MNKHDVIRAWKDPFYRASLSAEAQAALPPSPAGVSELTDEQIRALGSATVETTAPTCTQYTFLHWKSCCPPITTAITCTEYTFSSSAGCCPTTTA